VFGYYFEDATPTDGRQWKKQPKRLRVYDEIKRFEVILDLSVDPLNEGSALHVGLPYPYLDLSIDPLKIAKST